MPGLLGDFGKGLLGFVSDPQSWRDMGTNAVGLLGSPLPSKQEALAMALRRRMQGSVMRDYPSAETDLANSYREKMQNVALGMNPVLATVWHGSPHKFDAFDMSKIGTGEGAQAYGHGLYFAESPKVAGEYARTLTAKQNWRADELAPLNLDAGLYMAVGPKGVSKGFQNQRDAMEWALQGKENLYKVDLPDDQIARMLDWDKPLSQQPDGVQNSVRNALGIGSGPTWVKAADSFPKVVTNIDDIAQLNKLAKSAPQALEQDGYRFVDPLSVMTGKDVHFSLGGRAIGSKGEGEKRLLQAGIPGIRYLDGGSRGAGQGTSNFVIFDDKIPKILGRE